MPKTSCGSSETKMKRLIAILFLGSVLSAQSAGITTPYIDANGNLLPAAFGASGAHALTLPAGTRVTDPMVYTSGTPMSALVVDVTKQVNTKTSASNSYTLTFSATPAAGQSFGLRLTNGDSTDDVVT